MSSRPQFTPFQAIVNGNMSGKITSEVTIIQKLSMISYAFTWVGTSPTGTIDIQVSNDYSQNGDGSVKNAGTWNSLPLSSTPSVSGNTGNGFIDIDSSAGYAVRAVYTAISGTGTLQAIVSGKVA